VDKHIGAGRLRHWARGCDGEHHSANKVNFGYRILREEVHFREPSGAVDRFGRLWQDPTRKGYPAIDCEVVALKLQLSAD
jgi:hypothetical protein